MDIHLSLDGSPLDWSSTNQNQHLNNDLENKIEHEEVDVRRIPHELCLVSSKYDKSIGPWGVTHLRASKENLIRPERNLLGSAHFSDEVQ